MDRSRWQRCDNAADLEAEYLDETVRELTSFVIDETNSCRVGQH